MFEQIDSNVVGKKSKSKAKGTPRPNHKHDYKPIIVWSKSSYSGRINIFIACRCSICAKMEKKMLFFSWWQKEKNYLGELEHFFEENEKYTPIDGKIYQKIIFLDGSKTINRLEDGIKEDLIDFMNEGHNIVVGDCMGQAFKCKNFLLKTVILMSPYIIVGIDHDLI